MDFVILPISDAPLPIQTNIDVGYIRSEVEKRAALQRVDKVLEDARESIHAKVLIRAHTLGPFMTMLHGACSDGWIARISLWHI